MYGFGLDMNGNYLPMTVRELLHLGGADGEQEEVPPGSGNFLAPTAANSLVGGKIRIKCGGVCILFPLALLYP